MKKDIWLTINQATAMIMKHEACVKVARGSSYKRGSSLNAMNINGCAIASFRIFDGYEHPKARKNMVLEHGIKRWLNK